MHIQHEKLTAEERARCARVARKLIAREKTRRAVLCALYEEREAEHERRQTALFNEILEIGVWLNRYRSACRKLEFVVPADHEAGDDWRAAA